MELKSEQKYILTELGRIPEDWLGVKFEDVMTGFSSGQTPSRSRPDYFRGDIKWVTSGELNYNVITDTIEKITEDAVVDTGLKIIPNGTFLFAITGLEAAGTRGSCALLGVDATTNQSCMALYPKANLLTDYLYHFYVRYGNELAFRYCQGTKQQSFTGGIVKILPINIPPTIVEQAAIARALSETDALITGLGKLIAKKRNLKQGAMQELLRPKDGWSVRRLGEITDMFSGGTPLTTHQGYYNGSIPWVIIADITNAGKYISHTEKSISMSGIENSSAKLFKKGVLLFAMYASIGKTAIATMDTACNQAILGIQCKSVQTEYLYYVLSLNEKKYVKQGQTGTQSNLSKEIVQNFEIHLPSNNEQIHIANVLSDMDAEIDALECKLTKYKEIKQGMMQVLLTGRVRLSATTATKRTIELTPQPVKSTSATGHNVQFNEAVLISVLAGRYGNAKFPLSRFRYTKFLYLFHRHVEGAANGFLKKAAGPYNPSNRYKGPESIAIKNKYVHSVDNRGFIANDNIDEAKRYFGNWYQDVAMEWLDKFRYSTNNHLELLTTVDMAMEDLRKEDKEITVTNVKGVIAANKDWKAKLKKDFFNDVGISGAMKESNQLFS